jgi:CarD family transcriptional regulator
MQNGSLLQAAEVFKALLLLQGEKQLSFREKKMLERARHMLVSEISLARGVPDVHAMNLLERAIAKAGLRLPPPS